MLRIVPLVIFIVAVASGCSSSLNSVLYSSFKDSLPNTEVGLISSEPQILWRFNASFDTKLDMSAHEWQRRHDGRFDGWSWLIVTREQYELSAQEKVEWDRLFVRLAQATSQLLPNLSRVQLTLYLDNGEQQQVTLTTDLNSNELFVPYFHWSSKGDISFLPANFSERIDLLADLGSSIQQAHYVNNGLPKPNDDEAAQLKKHANSACWRLAVRPALAAGTKERLKAPPSAFLRLGDTAKAIYQANQTEVEAQTLYATVLLIKEADHYMGEQDLTWPTRGDDEVEIQALMAFCKSYLQQAVDPRL